MNTCKNCKYWGAYRENECDAPQSDLIGKGRAVATRDPAGFALHTTVADDTGLQESLITGPDFGCVRFHPRA